MNRIERDIFPISRLQGDSPSLGIFYCEVGDESEQLLPILYIFKIQWFITEHLLSNYDEWTSDEYRFELHATESCDFDCVTRLHRLKQDSTSISDTKKEILIPSDVLWFE